MKQRITGLDLLVLTLELRKELLSYRLQNISNLVNSSRQYLFKFAVPDSKKQLVVETGNYLHLTEYERGTTPGPTNFVSQLRKHLKTRRLTALRQVGQDRVIVFQFSDGLFYLVFEFFSAGNILLLDSERKILCLSRFVKEQGDVSRYAVNEEYKLFDESLFEISEQKLTDYTVEILEGWKRSQRERETKLEVSGKSRKVIISVHKFLFSYASYLSAELIKKYLEKSPLNSNEPYTVLEGTKLETAVDVLNTCEGEYRSLVEGNTSIKGHIILKKNTGYKVSESRPELEYTYEEFHTFQPYKSSMDDFKIEEISGYNKTLDKYFSFIESTRNSLRIDQQKSQALSRIDHAREERNKQIQSLLDAQEMNVTQANAIIENTELVSDCQDFIKGLLERQMDWTNIESLIRLDQSKSKRTALAFKLPLNLRENSINLLLEYPIQSEEENTDSDFESDFSSGSGEDSDDSGQKNEVLRVGNKGKKHLLSKNFVAVTIDLGLSVYGNADVYFDQKKSAATKMHKVEEKTGMALRNIQKKVNQDLARNLKDEQDKLKQIRIRYWFEKYFWFISSDGYLCLAGRDSQQADMIYFRHFGDNDLYVSSDVEGSLSVFVKNPLKGEQVPPSTLLQAGLFALSASKAWDAKLTTSAWYVNGSQLSKIDSEGSLIPSGMFTYNGERLFLPPTQLVMGFGFLWLVDEDSGEKYKSQRLKRETENGFEIIMDNKKSVLENVIKVNSLKLNLEPIMETKAVDEVETTSHKIIGDESNASFTTDSELHRDSSGAKETHIKNSNNLNMPITRGKRSKLKKIASKYGDQDEEDRRLRMEILGSTKKKPVQSDEAAKSQRQQKVSVRKRLDEKEYQKFIAMEEEDVSGQTNYIEILDSLVAKQTGSDHIIDAIPVVAPWQSLAKYKYKVKIQQGSAKKGKSLTEAINYFCNRQLDKTSSDPNMDWVNEREIIKTMKAADLVGQIPMTKLRVVLPDVKSNQLQKKKKK